MEKDIRKKIPKYLNNSGKWTYNLFSKKLKGRNLQVSLIKNLFVKKFISNTGNRPRGNIINRLTTQLPI